LGLFYRSIVLIDMTVEECLHRAREAKALAADNKDLWERDLLFKIADQWWLLAAHAAAKKVQRIPQLVVVKKPAGDGGTS
jgi:hypothetical protein